MIQYDQRIIGLINVFERKTRASVKDCFDEGEFLVFIIQPGSIHKAVGKGGENIRKMSALMKRKIKIIQFSEDVEKFVVNLLYPLKPETELRDGKLILKVKNSRDKGKIYGRERSNLKKIQELVNKYFSVEIVVE